MQNQSSRYNRNKVLRDGMYVIQLNNGEQHYVQATSAAVVPASTTIALNPVADQIQHSSYLNQQQHHAQLEQQPPQPQQQQQQQTTVIHHQTDAFQEVLDYVQHLYTELAKEKHLTHYCCLFCAQEYIDLRLLLRHTTDAHRTKILDGTINLEIDFEALVRKKILAKEQSQAQANTSANQQLYQCVQCQQMFNSLAVITEHLNHCQPPTATAAAAVPAQTVVQPQTSVESVSGYSVKVEPSPNDLDSSSSNQSQLLNIHDPYIPYGCAQCGRRYQTIRDLMNHMRLCRDDTFYDAANHLQHKYWVEAPKNQHIVINEEATNVVLKTTGLWLMPEPIDVPINSDSLRGFWVMPSSTSDYVEHIQHQQQQQQQQQLLQEQEKQRREQQAREHQEKLRIQQEQQQKRIQQQLEEQQERLRVQQEQQQKRIQQQLEEQQERVRIQQEQQQKRIQQQLEEQQERTRIQQEQLHQKRLQQQLREQQEKQRIQQELQEQQEKLLIQQQIMEQQEKLRLQQQIQEEQQRQLKQRQRQQQSVVQTIAANTVPLVKSSPTPVINQHHNQPNIQQQRQQSTASTIIVLNDQQIFNQSPDGLSCIQGTDGSYHVISNANLNSSHRPVSNTTSVIAHTSPAIEQQPTVQSRKKRSRVTKQSTAYTQQHSDNQANSVTNTYQMLPVSAVQPAAAVASTATKRKRSSQNVVQSQPIVELSESVPAPAIQNTESSEVPPQQYYLAYNNNGVLVPIETPTSLIKNEVQDVGVVDLTHEQYVIEDLDASRKASQTFRNETATVVATGGPIVPSTSSSSSSSHTVIVPDHTVPNAGNDTTSNALSGYNIDDLSHLDKPIVLEKPTLAAAIKPLKSKPQFMDSFFSFLMSRESNKL